MVKQAPSPEGRRVSQKPRLLLGRWGVVSSGVQGLTQHLELQLPAVLPSVTGGLTAVHASIRGLDGCEVDRAIRLPTMQGHPVLGPGQLGLWGAFGHAVQVQSFARQDLQDPWAWLHLGGD